MSRRHFLKRQNWLQYKFRKITVRFRNDVKVPAFLHVLCHSSAIFEDIDLKFCAHIYLLLPSDMFHVFFENFDFEGGNFEKGNKMLRILEIFESFEISKIRDFSSVAILFLRHLI